MNKNIKNNNEKHNLGIYIHIPFCVKKCEYCDFLSFKADSTLQKDYIEALIREILSLKELTKDYMVRSIFIGGGTPSIIDGNDIKLIMNSIKEVFKINSIEGNLSIEEVTIECNPGTLTKEKLLAYKEAGINRLSIGLQSANNEELKLLGRIHNFEEFVDNYKLARKIGFENINIDLMSALPGQTMDGWVNTLNKVISLSPEHISAYSLIIEEGTPFYKIFGEENWVNNDTTKNLDEYSLPDEEEDRKIYHKTKEILESNGYYRYEISNYAKPGYESIHNSSYWERIPYLGIGLGSSSLFNNKRFRNVKDIYEYIKYSYDHNKIMMDYEELTRNHQMEEFMFLGLRMIRGISKEEFMKQFHVDINQVYGQVLIKLIDENLLIEVDDQIILSEKGIDISNYVLSEFIIG